MRLCEIFPIYLSYGNVRCEIRLEIYITWNTWLLIIPALHYGIRVATPGEAKEAETFKHLLFFVRAKLQTFSR